jgi:hypothetical protein
MRKFVVVFVENPMPTVLSLAEAVEVIDIAP